MRSRYRRCVWFVLLVALYSAANTSQAQLWKHFVPGAENAADSDSDYALSDENGPWLIVAASFSGDAAEKQARELAQEFRERFRLPAYLHQMSFDFREELPGRGLDEYGAPIRRRYQRGDEVKELAVLVGNFPSIDDPEAQQALDRVKSMEPNALNVDASKTAQSMAQVRRFEDALLEKLGKPRKRGPMAQAFLTRNPLLPREFFVPKGVDSFVAKMNEGVEHSLLDCTAQYTIRVATFRGKSILQPDSEKEQSSKSLWNRKKKAEQNPLVEAAENAHLLTEELRDHGWEAYEFHDRTESIVTIGAFAQVAQKLPDGRTVPVPHARKIIETFGAAYDTPADPLTGIGNDPATRRRIEQEEQQFNLRFTAQQGQVVPGMNPKHVKIFQGSGKRRRVERIIPMDVHPQAIEVPKRSVSSAYAGS